jgi:hypothetical protein
VTSRRLNTVREMTWRRLNTVREKTSRFTLYTPAISHIHVKISGVTKSKFDVSTRPML